MITKEKILMLRLKGELTSQEIIALENIIKEHGDNYPVIGFDLTGLKFLDSSGIGFLINQYIKITKKNKFIKYFYKGLEQNIFSNEEMLKLCEQILSENALIRNNSKNDDEILSEEVEVKSDKYEEQANDDKKFIIVFKDKNKENDLSIINHTDIETLKQVDIEDNSASKNENNKSPKQKTHSPKTNTTKLRPLVAEKYEKQKVVGADRGVYKSGILIAFILFFSLFIPIYRNGNIINAWHFFNIDYANISIIGIIAISAICLIISFIPALQMSTKGSVLLLCGVMGVGFWLNMISYDIFLSEFFEKFFLVKNTWLYIGISQLAFGALLLLFGRGKKNLTGSIILILFLIILLSIYIIPFKYNIHLVSVNLSERMLLTGLIKNITKSKDVIQLILSIYLLLPFMLGLLSIIVFFIKPKNNTKNNIAIYIARVILFHFPLLIIASGVLTGIKTKPIIMSNFIFIGIVFSVFSILLVKGLYFMANLNPVGMIYKSIKSEFEKVFLKNKPAFDLLTEEKKNYLSDNRSLTNNNAGNFTQEESATQISGKDFLQFYEQRRNSVFFMGFLILLIFISPWQKINDKLSLFFNISIKPDFGILLLIALIISILYITLHFLWNYKRSVLWKSVFYSGFAGFLTLIIFCLINEEFARIFNGLTSYQNRFTLGIIPISILAMSLYAKSIAPNKKADILFHFGAVLLILLYVIPIIKPVRIFPIFQILNMVFKGSSIGIALLLPLILVIIGYFIFKHEKRFLGLCRFCSTMLLIFYPVFFILYAINISSILNDFAVITFSGNISLLLSIYQLSLCYGFITVIHKK